MSQICRFYLRGECRYGSSCHFLHENNYNYNQRRDQENYNYRSNQENYNYRNNQENYNYRNNQTENYGHRNNQECYNNYNYRNKYYADSHQNSYKTNFNRYHVDNRQYNQAESKLGDELTQLEFYEIVRVEVEQFEERHVWPLTVISPLKAYGNIPGFKDFSPEEIRYHFHIASNNDSYLEFKQSVDELKENVIQCCRILKTKSTQGFNIVREMMNQPQTAESTSYVFPTRATTCNSNFTFDLNALSKSNSEFDTSPVQFNTNTSAFSSPLKSQTASSMNSFSFNLGDLNNQKTEPISQPLSVFRSIPANPAKTENNPIIYSQLNELTPAEIAMFHNRSFKYGEIPQKPPPKELCH